MKSVKEFVLKDIAGNVEKVDSFEEYEIDEETAKTDARGFISELLVAGFIDCSKEDRTW